MLTSSDSDSEAAPAMPELKPKSVMEAFAPKQRRQTRAEQVRKRKQAARNKAARARREREMAQAAATLHKAIHGGDSSSSSEEEGARPVRTRAPLRKIASDIVMLSDSDDDEERASNASAGLSQASPGVVDMDEVEDDGGRLGKRRSSYSGRVVDRKDPSTKWFMLVT